MIDDSGRSIRTFDELRAYLRRLADGVIQSDITDALVADAEDIDALDRLAEISRARNYTKIDALLERLRASGVFRQAPRVMPGGDMTVKSQEVELLEAILESAKNFGTLVVIRKGNIDIETAQRFLDLVTLAEQTLQQHRAEQLAPIEGIH